MIQCNISNDDRLIIEPWNSIKGIIKINHPQVFYDHINNIAQIKSDQPYIYIASYNGDGGLWETNIQNEYRLGCTFTSAGNIRLPEKLKYLFSTNINVINSKIINMPYGIGALKQFDTDKDWLCYARFSIWTSHVRPQIRSWCEAQPFIISEFSNSPAEQSEETCNNFYRGLSRAKFTICPPGNGPDTYRVWEALYLNCIPIVINCPLYQSFCNNLPILCVNSFEEVTEKLLYETYEKYINQTWNYDPLRLSYYNKLIEKAIESLC